MNKEQSINPIPYMSMGHRIFMVDDTTDDTPLDPKIKAYTYDANQKSYALEDENVLPLSYMKVKSGVEIQPTISNEDHKKQASARLKKKVDRLAFNLAIHCCPQENIIERPEFNFNDISYAMTFIEEHNVIASKVIVHPKMYHNLRIKPDSSIFCQATQRDILMCGLYGHIWSADVHVSTEMPNDRILVVGYSPYVGIAKLKQLEFPDVEKQSDDTKPPYCDSVYYDSLLAVDRCIEYIKTPTHWYAEAQFNFIVRNPNLFAQIIIR